MISYILVCFLQPSVIVFLQQPVSFHSNILDCFYKSTVIVSFSKNLIYAGENWGSPITLIYSH